MRTYVSNKGRYLTCTLIIHYFPFASAPSLVLLDKRKSFLCCLFKEFMYVLWMRRVSPAITTKANLFFFFSTCTHTELKVNLQNLSHFSKKFPSASPLLVKQQYPDAWINVATNNCGVPDCERCHACTRIAAEERRDARVVKNLCTRYGGGDSLH